MTNKPTPLVLISGPVGVGKTSVASELSDLLESEEVAHTYIDLDQLSYTYPRPADDRWNNRLALQNLASIWANGVAAGARNLLISYVVEEQSFIEELRDVIPAADITVIQLSAGEDALTRRLKNREIGSGLAWHLNRAVELSQILLHDDAPCDHRIQTDDRSVVDVASELFGLIAWNKG